MKTYRVCTVKLGKGLPPHYWPTIKYFKGLSAARKSIPAKLQWSRNAKAFVGYKDGFEYWAVPIN